MKFGKTYGESVIPEWRFYYMDYMGLKRMLKDRTSEGSFFAEKDEAAFVGTLERELQKVFDFRDVKAGELTRHVQHCETSIDTAEPADVNVQELEGEIERITQEVSNLSSFSRLNHTAFVKILKKHDKHTEFMLKPMFMMRLNPRMQQTEVLDSLIYRLSKLFDKLHRGPQDLHPSDSRHRTKQSEAQAFIRKTAKYWVHPDNVVEVKCSILRHLPVLVFPSAERKVDPAINSVYLDNPQLELYKGRIEKSEGAEAIRLRWYGSTNSPQTVFVERKTHKEDWTGEVSVKERFAVKEKHLDDYLHGHFMAHDVTEKLRKHDQRLTEADLEATALLAQQVQDKVLVGALVPTLRTFYNRTAFQLPGDSRVRISLDTDLCMIRESTDSSHWKRTDIGSIHPFSDVSASQIVRFPYAILEVKLQVEGVERVPDWITQLTEGQLVESVPKFSKFIHGVASLFQPDVVPYWLPQMQTDIKRPWSVQDRAPGEEAQRTPHHISIPIIRSEADRGRRDERDGGGEEYEKEEEEDEEEEGESDKSPLMVGTSSMINNRARQNTGQDKRIAVPVRVEPKVYFANERTFLSWIHFSIFLGGVSTALVGLGDDKARASGFLFGAVSVLFTLYALYLYRWRAARIRRRDPGPYDDLVGPTLVSGVFLLAMLSNMVFSWKAKP